MSFLNDDDGQLFVCKKCNCVDVIMLAEPDKTKPHSEWLCSGCKPGGQWHNQFEQKEYNEDYDIVVNR